jgi:hypothetical protein
MWKGFPMRVRMLVSSAALAGLVLAGCGGDDDGGGLGGLGGNPSEEDVANSIEDAIEEAASDAGEGDVNVDFDSDGEEISIEGDDGEQISFGGGDLPDGFPDDIPFPDDFEQAFASSDGSGFFVSGTSGESVDDLDSFYAEALGDAGYEIDDRTEATSDDTKFVTFSFTGNGSTGTVSLGTDPSTDGTAVSVAIDAAA